jgi:hypothetical protein
VSSEMMPNQISHFSTSPTAMQLACISVLYGHTVDDSRCAEWISASAISAVHPADGSCSAHGTASARMDGAKQRDDLGRNVWLSSVLQELNGRAELGSPYGYRHWHRPRGFR